MSLKRYPYYRSFYSFIAGIAVATGISVAATSRPPNPSDNNRQGGAEINLAVKSQIPTTVAIGNAPKSGS